MALKYNKRKEIMDAETDYRKAKILKKTKHKTTVSDKDDCVMFEVNHIADKILMVGLDFTKEDCVITTYLHLN